MKKFCLLLFLFCALGVSAAEKQFVEGRVIKYPLNVRAGGSTRYTVVAKLTKFNPVRIVGVGKDFLQIVPPANSRVWVMARYVKNNKLTATVNLRSGPGSGYEAVGTGRRGLSVKVAGKATPGGWIPLAVPENSAVFYVGRLAVEADAKKLANLPVFTSPGPVLPNIPLINLEGNFTSPGKSITAQGYIYKEGAKPITHALFEAKGDDLIPKYFLLPARNKINAPEGSVVKIYGDCYQVKNWDMPVVVVSHYTVLPGK